MTSQKLLSVFAFLAMIAAAFGLASAGSFSSEPGGVIFAQACAIGLMVWARLTFGLRSFHAIANPTTGGLVTEGPYAYVRHPIYTAACLFVWPAAIAHETWLAIVFAALLTFGAITRMLCEESLLAKKYPEYETYAHSTRRMIPYVYCRSGSLNVATEISVVPAT